MKCTLSKQKLVDPLKFAAHLVTGCNNCLGFLKNVIKDYQETMNIVDEILETDELYEKDPKQFVSLSKLYRNTKKSK